VARTIILGFMCLALSGCLGADIASGVLAVGLPFGSSGRNRDVGPPSVLVCNPVGETVIDPTKECHSTTTP